MDFHSRESPADFRNMTCSFCWEQLPTKSRVESGIEEHI